MGLKITLSGQTTVKPTALGPVVNTDTKLLIYRAISKGPSFGTGRGIGHVSRSAVTVFALPLGDLGSDVYDVDQFAASDGPGEVQAEK